jgi:hypothetical protein
MIPTYIRSPADFAGVVTIGVTTESLVLDFKQEINTKNPLRSQEQQEFCRDVAQFANSHGGCVLVGVQEELDPVSRLKRAIGIKNVDEPDKLIQWLEQAIGLWLVPSTFSHEIVVAASNTALRGFRRTRAERASRSRSRSSAGRD